jgi:hypothetical protein
LKIKHKGRGEKEEERSFLFLFEICGLILITMTDDTLGICG